VLAGLPESTVGQLQRVQNAAVLLVFGLCLKDPIFPSLLQQHWLPVRYRITFKLRSVMFSVRFVNCPLCLLDCVTTIATQSHWPGLLSPATTYCCSSIPSLANERLRVPVHVHGIASRIRCAVQPVLPFLNVASKRICLRLLLFNLINFCFWTFFFFFF
jgi:hypothetical protein